jgi:hypothetical protein
LKDSFGLGGDEPDNDPQTISRIPSATVRALGRLIWKKRKEEKLNPDWVGHLTLYLPYSFSQPSKIQLSDIQVLTLSGQD